MPQGLGMTPENSRPGQVTGIGRALNGAIPAMTAAAPVDRHQESGRLKRHIEEHEAGGSQLNILPNGKRLFLKDGSAGRDMHRMRIT